MLGLSGVNNKNFMSLGEKMEAEEAASTESRRSNLLMLRLEKKFIWITYLSFKANILRIIYLPELNIYSGTKSKIKLFLSKVKARLSLTMLLARS